MEHLANFHSSTKMYFITSVLHLTIKADHGVQLPIIMTQTKLGEIVQVFPITGLKVDVTQHFDVMAQIYVFHKR